MKSMRKCGVCGKYTLQESHCGQATKNPHPARFSIDDKYAKYRRQARES